MIPMNYLYLHEENRIFDKSIEFCAKTLRIYIESIAKSNRKNREKSKK